jgi:dihydroorotate dehydrogenase (fumarate)
MDLSTTYLGLKLESPLMAGASPLVDDLDMLKRLADAGSSAFVMHSLFEEQLVAEQIATSRYLESPAESFSEATTYFPNTEKVALGPDEYLDRIHAIKNVVDLPVIGSLNGTTPGGWLDYARQMETAGIDALELNIYCLPTDLAETGQAMEQRTLEMVKTIKAAVNVPVAVKLSPFYSSFANFAKRLEEAGADGLVLFNRFYQPDIDTDAMEVQSRLTFSDSSELLLRLRWLAILSGRVNVSLAVTGGVHTGLDAVKSIMCGADAVQMVSAILQKGPEQLRTIKQDLIQWLQQHEYNSLQELKGAMNLAHSPAPKAFERANYVELLKSWDLTPSL